MKKLLNKNGLIISSAAFVLLLFLGFSLFSSTGRDDVYITYWSSYALAQLGGILNYNGSMVEQSSSLLHVILLALPHYLTGIQVHVIGPLFSLICSFFTLWVIYRLGCRWSKEVGLIALLILSTSTYFIYWSFSGLESTLMAFLSVVLIYFLSCYFTEKGSLKKDSVLFCIVLSFILVRPENMFVVFSLIMGLAVIFLLLHLRGEGLDSEITKYIRFSAISLLAVTLMVAFRYFYFGDFFPQPVSAKMSGISLSSIGVGLWYLRTNFLFGFWSLKFVIILSGFAFITYRLFYRGKKLELTFHLWVLILSLLFGLAYLSFIILSGGDWMESARFLVPLVPFFSLLIALFISELQFTKAPKIASVIFLIVLQIGISVQLADRDSTGVPIFQAIDFYSNSDNKFRTGEYTWFEVTNRVHRRDIPTIYHLKQTIRSISEHKNNKVQVMTMQMGMVPYFISLDFFGDVEFTDLKGLTDRKFFGCIDDFYLSKKTDGLDLDIRYYLESKEAFKKLCGIEEPDIIYDLGKAQKRGLASDSSYKVIYQQVGKVNSGSDYLKGGRISAEQFIAVKKEFVDAVEVSQMVIFDFDRLNP